MTNPFSKQPPQCSSSGAKMCRDEGAGGKAGGAQSATRVEPEPTHPQETSANQADDQAVWLHRLPRESDSLPQIERAHESTHTRSNVNHGAACEVKAGELAARKCVQKPCL